MSRWLGSRRTRVAVAAVVAGLLLSACATIPTSTAPEVIDESVEESSPPQNIDPRYDVIQPQPGEQPIDVVRDYLAVGGSIEGQHAGARAYLTPQGAKSWKDAAGVVALEDATVHLFATEGGAEVTMGARQRGRVEADGAYLPSAAPFPYTFRLEKVGGEWRIDNPPDGVLVKASTFERSWRPYNVYFLDSTRSRVVPDVRMVPFPQDKALPSLLVSALGAGPSEWLGDAVHSDLEGVRLQSNIVQENDRVRVFLTGIGDGTDTLDAGGFAQLVWTLNQLGVGGIEVYLDGQLVSPQEAKEQKLQRFGDWRSFDPDGLSVSTPGYFVRAGAVLTTVGAPVPGPAGTGAYAAISVGVSTDQRSMAVVGRGAGDTVSLLVGRTGGLLRPVLAGASLTPPTWGGSASEVWTVRDGREVILVPISGAASRVVAPALDRFGPVQALRLSRDGARVAIVGGPSGRQRLLVGVVLRQNGAVRIDGLRPAEVGDGPVSDVSWSDALTLTALVRARQQDSGLYSVSIDGRTAGQLVSPSGLPGPPSATAAAPNLPLLTVATGSIWGSPGSGEPWSRVTRDSIADSAPAYPG